MHRGLLIRQVFTMLELSLLVLVAAGSYVLLSRVLDKTPPVLAAGPQDGDSTQVIKFFELHPADDYKSILEANLFGPAGTEGSGTGVVAPPTPKDEKRDPTLPLKLRGVTALGEKDPMSSALIEDTGRKKTDCFFVGQIVRDQAKLVAVRPREVVIFNPAMNQNEIYTLDDDKKGATKLAGAKGEAAQPTAEAGAAGTTALNKTEIADALATNMEALLAVVPQQVTDEAGNVTGLTADNISSLPLADKLGLQDKDELQQINGQKVDSVEKIQELVQKFSDVGTFRLQLVRDGKKINKTFKLE